MCGVLGHDSALYGYSRSGTTLANEMNLIQNAYHLFIINLTRSGFELLVVYFVGWFIIVIRVSGNF